MLIWYCCLHLSNAERKIDTIRIAVFILQHLTILGTFDSRLCERTKKAKIYDSFISLTHTTDTSLDACRKKTQLGDLRTEDTSRLCLISIV